MAISKTKIKKYIEFIEKEIKKSRKEAKTGNKTRRRRYIKKFILRRRTLKRRARSL